MPEDFLRTTLPLCERLTPAAVSIIKSILEVNGIEYLTVIGRVKKFETAINKIKLKKYKDLKNKFTDLSGIRVILFSESDVSKTCKLIEETFTVDRENSLNQDEKLGIDKSGYRSVHYVCQIGDKRGGLPEFSNLLDLKFEIQIRTVLQHAWAELSHDRNYKFGIKLPLELERRLHLYAALLELADKGFDELSKSIDQYAKDLMKDNSLLGADVNSISLVQFIKQWSDGMEDTIDILRENDYEELIGELNHFGVKTIEQLSDLAPKDYLERIKKNNEKTTILGLIRDWMIIKDWERLANYKKREWAMTENDFYENETLKSYLKDETFSNILFHYSPEMLDIKN